MLIKKYLRDLESSKGMDKKMGTGFSCPHLYSYKNDLQSVAGIVFNRASMAGSEKGQNRWRIHNWKGKRKF